MSEPSRSVVIGTEVDSTGARAGFNEVERQAEQMAQGVARAGQQAERGVSGVGAGAGRSAQQIEAAQRSVIASIQRTTVAMEAGGRTTARYYELVGQQRGVDPAVLAPYLAQLRAVEQAQARANTALGGAAPALRNVGVSAAQTAAALRGVPAQFTDIVTSIQGGQAPLTVFLQQGGQLRDMFGSAGGAARALGGYVAGLVTPLTVAAAAAAALGVAYYQGAQEAHAYNQALILSGNAAGTTAGQLSDMARSISKTVGTQGAAAESLAAMVGTGKVAASNLEQFSTIAVNAQRALGQGVADTASEFADLSRAPIASLEKLNEKYHFLTGSVYEQVKALQDQGRMYDAGQLAQQAYATAFDGVAARVDKNLGLMQRGWRHVTDGAKSAWDAMLDIGREDSLEQKLAAVQKRLATTPSAKLPNGLTAGSAGRSAAYDAQHDKDLAEETSLKNQIALQTTKAALEADQARFNAADLEWSKTKTQNLTRAKQLENELASVRQKGLDAGISDLDINKELTKVRLKYSDIYNDGIDSQIAALKRRSAVEDVLSQRTVDRIAFERTAGMITDEQATERTNAAELAALDKRRVAMVEELSLIRQKQNSLKDQKDKIGEIDALDQERISRAAKGTNDLFLLEQKRYRLAAENAANVIEADMAERNSLAQSTQAQLDYNEQIGLTKKQVGELTALRLRERAARKDEEADIAEGLDLEGKRAAIIRAQAQELRNRAAAAIEGGDKEFRYDQFKQAVDQYSQVFQTGFADMLNHGKDGWRSFTQSLVTTFKTSVADQLYKMLAKPFIVQLVGNFMGMSQSAIANEIAGSSGGSAIGSAGGSMLSSAAGGLGTGFMGSLAGGLNGAGIGSGLTSSAGLALGNGIADVVGSSVAGAMSTGLAAMAAAAPYVAAIVAAVALVKTLDHSGTPHIGGAASASSAGVSTIAAESLHFEKTRTSADAEKMTAQLASGIVGILDSTALAFGKTAGYTAATAFADDSSKDGAWGGLVISKLGQTLVDWQDSRGSGPWAPKVFADGAEGQKQYLAAISGDVRTALNGIGLPDWAQKMLDGLGKDASLDDMAKTVDAINSTQKALKSMGDTLVGFSSLSEGAVSALMAAAGGIQNLAAGASAYYDNFYSDAEKNASAIKQVSDAIAAAGLAVPATDKEFRALVEAQMALGEAGAPTVAALFKVAGAFAQVHPAIDATTAAVQDQSSAMQAAADAIQKAQESARQAYQDIGNAFAGAIGGSRELAKSLRDLSKSLEIGDLSPLSGGEQYALAKDRLSKANGAEVQGAATAFLQAAKGNATDGISYARDFAFTQQIIQKAAAGEDQYAKSLVMMFQSMAQDRIPGFANGGDFAGGLRIVGERGPELEATGPSRITNSQAFLSRLSSPNESNAVLAAAVERLTTQNENMAKMLDAALTAIAKHTMQTAEHLDDVVNGEKPLTTKAA